ncbi:rod shape-determining protein MreD [Collinsella sp. AGMB00827]|uniref:Rod shape-determining protein MreD n=1 Tax=Collinsella ureilytica TaxID=2869515 RepID=A0ABS7MLY3_9ACTN|nr:rod shape-determining protein MreD [Collinsella urealyticum]MBY4798068.1 rod shape-determining protein MreD [Collinsella urealyticum]
MAGLGEFNARTLKRVAPYMLAGLLQAGLIPHISLFGGRPDLLVAVVCAQACGMAPGTAACIGFACGLLSDLLGAAPIGVTPLFLSLAAFILATSSKSIALGMTSEGIRLSTTSSAAVMLVSSVAMLALGVLVDPVHAILVTGLVSAVLTALTSILFLTLGSPREGRQGFSARPRTGTRYRVLG